MRLGPPSAIHWPSRDRWPVDALTASRGQPAVRSLFLSGMATGDGTSDGVVPTTAEILALRKLNRTPDRRWAEWAIELLIAGHDSPTLRVLAGEAGPFQPFEVWAMTDRVIEELNLVPFADDLQAAIALTTEQTRRMLDGRATLEQGLSTLYHLCIELDMSSELMDFYLLHEALEDLQHYGEQYYLSGVDESNIRAVIEERCRSWLEQHRRDGR